MDRARGGSAGETVLRFTFAGYITDSTTISGFGADTTKRDYCRAE